MEIGAARGSDRRSPARSFTERMLVLAPTAEDATLIFQLLNDGPPGVVSVDGLSALTREIETGAGVVVMSAEALKDEAGCRDLRFLIEHQEPWSDLPILMIGTAADAARVPELLGGSAHVVFLERPPGATTFVTAANAALRSRRRQYEVRRLLDELAASAAATERGHGEASRAKDAFLATIAHELSSPVTAIRGWIEMLRSGKLNRHDAENALAMLESSTRVQAQIIEDLMDISRILAGKAMIQAASVELAPIVRDVVATYRPAAGLRGIDLTADITGEPLTVWADEVRLRQVGWNLLSNAVKFTPAGGSIRVSLQREDSSAVLRVSDSGSGIPPELLPHVFERYRQADGDKRPQRGLGLGLAIVRHLVESHGGTVEAIGKKPGSGAEFIVKLPLRD